MTFYNEKTGEVTASEIYVPCFAGMPFVTMLYDSPDQYAPVFSDPRKLHEFMRELGKQLHIPSNYTVMTVRRVKEYCQVHVENSVRIMVDPVIVSPTRTVYNEMVFVADKLFMRSA